MCQMRNSKPSSQSDIFRIFPYKIETLIKELSSPMSSLEIISQKNHITFLENYLQTLNTRSFLIEDEYVDKDFLEDHSLYYARCFREYHRFCKRIHFFSEEYSQEQLSNIFFDISPPDDQIEKFKNSYLGFMVVKPLPLTVIGRTCLKTYEHTRERHYLTIRPFCANLFGVELSVTSLPFQEQDSVVAACATSALWSAFNITSKLFGHSVLSPCAITQFAVEQRFNQSRPFPNTVGLTVEQMAHAIFKVGLEPLCINIDLSAQEGRDIFLANIYAYAKFSIPSLLLVSLFDESVQKIIGYHAITVIGYHFGNASCTNTLPLKSARIDKLYGHDDQIGPFTRIEENANKWYSSWPTQKNQGTSKVEIRPNLLLIPIYHKIRIPFEIIWQHIYRFHSAFVSIRDYLPEEAKPFFDGIIWDIYLISNCDLKEMIRKDGKIPEELRKKILLQPLPKFLWIASASRDVNPLVTYVFDATDIEQGLEVLLTIPYDDKFDLVARKISKNRDPQDIVLKSYIP